MPHGRRRCPASTPPWRGAAQGSRRRCASARPCACSACARWSTRSSADLTSPRPGGARSAQPTSSTAAVSPRCGGRGAARGRCGCRRSRSPEGWPRTRMTEQPRVSIALPTGVLLGGALKVLARAGVARLSAEALGRQLLLERSGVRVILVRPADVPAYVDHGAADLGIVGKDILWETPGAHYELVDLRFGGCRLVLAVPDS